MTVAGGPVLALSSIRVTRGKGMILDVPAFEARAGEVVAIIGPNGAGKSTFLRVAAWPEARDAGAVSFRGRAVHAARALAERRQMATVFQTPLLADTTVAANVTLGLRFRKVPWRETEPRVARALERLGVSHLAGRNVRALSSTSRGSDGSMNWLFLESSSRLFAFGCFGH